MWWIGSAFAGELVLDGKSEPQVIDLTGKDDVAVHVPLDGSVDLAAFVVETPEGPTVLDELVAKAGEEYLKFELHDVIITSVDTGPSPPKPFCITIFGVRVCAPA